MRLAEELWPCLLVRAFLRVLVALSRDGPGNSPSLGSSNRSAFFGWLPEAQKAEARSFLPLLMCPASTSQLGPDPGVTMPALRWEVP